METEEPRRRPIEIQVAVLASELKGLRRDVEEIQQTLERWLENAARDRTALLVAFVSAWLGLIAAAVSALLHK